MIIPNQHVGITVVAFFNEDNWDQWPVLAWHLKDDEDFTPWPITFESLDGRVAWCLVYDGPEGPAYVFPDHWQFPPATCSTLLEARDHVAQLLGVQDATSREPQ